MSEPPWGHIYTSTSSINDGDQLGPTIKNVYPEHSVHLSDMLHNSTLM